MTAVKVVSLDRTPKQIPADVVSGTFFERHVPCDQMFIADRATRGGYARPLNERRAAKLAAEFDPKAVGLLLLSMRDDGRFAIIDGQHRREAAMRNGITGLDAYVYIDLTLAEEAGLYRKFGDYLRQTARDRWFAAIAERQPEALAIERMLAEYGLRVVNDARTQHGIAAVQSLWTVAQDHGPHILRETIHTLHDAYEGDPMAYVGPSLIGMAMFLDRFNANPKYSRKRLVARMARDGTTKLEQQALHVMALERCSKGTAYGKALLAMHDSVQGVQSQYRLGAWEERSLKPEHRAKLRENIKLASAMSAQVRQAGAIARANEIACPTCHVPVGRRCVEVLTGQQHHYVHMNRLRAAAEARRKS